MGNLCSTGCSCLHANNDICCSSNDNGFPGCDHCSAGCVLCGPSSVLWSASCNICCTSGIVCSAGCNIRGTSNINNNGGTSCNLRGRSCELCSTTHNICSTGCSCLHANDDICCSSDNDSCRCCS